MGTSFGLPFRAAQSQVAKYPSTWDRQSNLVATRKANSKGTSKGTSSRMGPLISEVAPAPAPAPAVA
jgi:hypothetical protein